MNLDPSAPACEPALPRELGRPRSTHAGADATPRRSSGNASERAQAEAPTTPSGCIVTPRQRLSTPRQRRATGAPTPPRHAAGGASPQRRMASLATPQRQAIGAGPVAQDAATSSSLSPQRLPGAAGGQAPARTPDDVCIAVRASPGAGPRSGSAHAPTPSRRATGVRPGPAHGRGHARLPGRAGAQRPAAAATPSQQARAIAAWVRRRGVLPAMGAGAGAGALAQVAVRGVGLARDAVALGTWVAATPLGEAAAMGGMGGLLLGLAVLAASQPRHAALLPAVLGVTGGMAVTLASQLCISGGQLAYLVLCVLGPHRAGPPAAMRCMHLHPSALEPALALCLGAAVGVLLNDVFTAAAPARRARRRLPI